MTVEVRGRPALPRHELRSPRLLAALHDRDRRSPETRVVHEHLLLRALRTKPGR